MKKSVSFFVLALMLLSGVARAGEWYEKIKLKGDFRHRHELIQEEDKGYDRNRWRIRARLSLDAAVTDDWGVHMRLATGSDDPVSTNETLTGGFTTKGFHLDRAYFDFHPAAVEGLQIIGGKIELPFMVVEKTELIWDGDLNPEGASFMYTGKATEAVHLMLNGAFFYVEERKSTNDTWMAGAQAAVEVKATDEVDIVFGGGYYDYQKIKGQMGIYDPEDFFGNTHEEVTVGDETFDAYAWDYNLFEAFGQLGFKRDKVSVSLYGNFVTNTDPDSLNTGYLFGAALSHGKDKGRVNFSVNYREVEKDAVLGVFTDSDFRGGGTDGNGFEFGAGYGIASKVNLDLTYFLNNKGIEEKVEYKRLQVDLSVKF